MKLLKLNPFFRILELFYKFFSRVIGWQPIEKRIILKILDTKDPGMFGATIHGTIHNIVYGIETSGPLGVMHIDDLCAVIKLDYILHLKNRDVEWVIVHPRYQGSSLYNLCLTKITVYLLPLDDNTPPKELLWNNIIAICSMKISK